MDQMQGVPQGQVRPVPAGHVSENRCASENLTYDRPPTPGRRKPALLFSLLLFDAEPERLLEHAVHVQVDGVAADRPALRRLRAGKDPMYSPFAEKVVSGFSVILVFGSSPATFSANHTAFNFNPGPATTRYTAKTFGVSGAKTLFSSCEYLSLATMASLKCDPADAACGLVSSDAEIPGPRRVAASTTRTILLTVPPSRLTEVLPPKSSPQRSRASGAAYLIVVASGSRRL